MRFTFGGDPGAHGAGQPLDKGIVRAVWLTADEIRNSVPLHRSPLVLVVAVAGGLIVGGLAQWAPIIRGHGIPEAMEAVLTKQSRIAPRTALAKP